MASDQLLEQVIYELREQNTSPLAVHTNAGSTITYIIYGIKTINNIPGYPIQRISTPTDLQTYIDNGFLKEEDRGAVNLKTDYAGSLTLVGTVTYG